MLISPAYAQSAGGGGFDLTAFLPLILIFGIFYFLLIRPQQKKVKDHRAMVGALRRGDKVVTAGGIIGSVHRENENELVVEIADGIRVKVVRSTISEVVAKTAPAPAPKDDDKDDDKD